MNSRSKVLIVDDLETNQYAVSCVIEDLDIQIFYASSGLESLRMVQDHQFAVILMDVCMPEMSGIEATKLIHDRKQSKDVPIVMVTASDDNSEVLLEAYEMGAIDYVTKPIEPIILISKVKQFVEFEKQRVFLDKAHSAQVESNSRLQVLLNSAGEGIIGLDLAGHVTFANPKAASILLLDQRLLLERNIQSFVITEPSSTTQNFHLCDTLLSRAGQRHNEQWAREDGSQFDAEYSCEPIEDSDEAVVGGVVMFQDVSKRKAIEERMKFLANYDSLTQLANRAYFHDSLKKGISRAKRSNSKLSIMMLDLDHFKYVNDTYGHDGGDLLLQVISKRIETNIRDGDVLARLGGDEFAIILFDINVIDDVTMVAQKIIDVVSEDVDLKVAQIKVSTSIGIALYEDKATNLAELIKAADTALYEAKEQGGNNHQVFVSSMQADMLNKQRIKVMLQRAVLDNELSISYQPKVSISSRKVVGCEALLRWQPKSGEKIGPGEFIPLAEESGQITEIGEWVLNEVCRQIQIWIEQDGFFELSISINVSTRQFRSGNFHQQVEKAINMYSVPSEILEFEITETGVLEDQLVIIKELQHIHELGINVSIDDFGTGNASLDYLRKFPLDTLKIDRSFVNKIGVDKRDEELIRVMVAVAHTMALSVVAEGVETEEQLKFLVENHCDVIQGYYFSPPVFVGEMTKFFQNKSGICRKKFELFDNYLEVNNNNPYR